VVPDIKGECSREKTSHVVAYIYEDEHGWIYEPHGEESEQFYTTLQGSEVRRECGWKAHCMHRVSRFVHEALLIDEWLVYVDNELVYMDNGLVFCFVHS